MRTRTSLLAPVALVAALSIATLAGCSSTGSDSSSTSSSSSTQAAASLPSDFPKSDVPLVDGQVVVARGDKDNGWSVTVQPTTKTGFADATAALEKAGYTKQAGSTDSKAVYTNDKYTVAVGTPGVSVTYTITAN
ncbi:hypothetical protein [Leifsonia aquatica]|uniref:hypothetical protein n=1 Tax=Leifsonia aquatica TaxID=144185 RepID=UPI00046A0DDC|nr:hypothetical protein [Leifsonia aquatica]